MKYTFVRGALATVVWDPTKGVALAEFVGGKFTTSDPEVAQKLHDFGYKDITEYPDGPPEGGFKPRSNGPNLNAGDPTVNVKVPKSEAQALTQHNLSEDSKQDPEDDDDDDDEEKSRITKKKKKKKKKVLVIKKKKSKANED